MGAVGLNGATAQATDPTERTRLSSLGWKRWAPIQAAAFGTHLLADLVIAFENKGRVAKQEGVGRLTTYKTVVTAVGAAVTFCAWMAGKKVDKLAGEGAEGATEPHLGAPKELAMAQKQLKILQWAIPVFAGWVIILGAKHGEMQRPKNVLKGLMKK
jgi:hypothetical protein